MVPRDEYMHSQDEGDASKPGDRSESQGEVEPIVIRPLHRANRVQPLAWMAQSPLGIQGPLHDMARYTKKHLPNFDHKRGTLDEDHIINFYLSLQMMRVQYTNVACQIFPHTLENKPATWYHSFPVASIQTWEEFC